MATRQKAPDFQQEISQVNPTTYVQKFSSDYSEGMKLAADTKLAQGLIATGIDAYKAYDKQSTLAEITDQLNQLEEERYGRSLQGIQNLQSGIAQNEQQRDLIKKEAGYDNTYPMMLNTNLNNQVQGVNKSLDEQTTKLMKAKEQGIMTEFEIGERLAKITREAVTKNPAYAGEIMGHVTKVAEMMNMTAKVKEDVNIVKEQKKLMADNIKKIEDTAIALGISPWNNKYKMKDGVVDYDTRSQDVTIALGFKENKVKLDNIKDARLSSKTIKAEDYISSGEWIFDQNTILNDFIDKATAILQDPNTQNKEIALSNLENTILNQELNQTLYNSGLDTENSSLKEGISGLKSQINSLNNDFKLYASGKMDKDRYDNIVSIEKNKAIINVANGFKLTGKNFFTHQIFADLSKDLPELFRSENYTSMWRDIDFSKYALNTEDGTEIATSLTLNKSYLNNQSPQKVITDKVWERAKANEAYLPKFTNELDKYNRILDNPDFTQQQGVKVTRDLIKNLQDPALRDVNNKLDPTVLAITNQNVLDYTQVLENNVKGFKQSKPNLKLETIRRDDGTIQIKGLSPNDSFARGVNQINEAFRAFYNTSNLSLEQASSAFYGNIPSLGLGGTPPQKQ